MYRTRVGILFFILLLLLNTPMSQAKDIIRLASIENAVEQFVATLLLKDIYAKIDLQASIEPLPGKRANMLTVHGIKDGEVARITPYTIQNPTLLRVDPAYYYLTTAVFAKKERAIKISTKADLQNYRIGIVSGIAHSAKAVSDIKNVVIVTNYEQLYLMILADRIDLAIDTGINGLAETHHLGLDKTIEMVGVIATYGLHNILHPSNAALQAKVSATIKTMQQSGELEKLTAKYEKQIIGRWKTPSP